MCYSHNDSAWLNRVNVHLGPIVQGGKVDVWADNRIRPGDEFRKEIESALKRAMIAVVLDSGDFYASEFINEVELPSLLEAEMKRGLTILCVHVLPSRFGRDKLSKFQSVNDPNTPLGAVSRNQQEEVFDNLAERVEELVGAGTQDQSASNGTQISDRSANSRSEEILTPDMLVFDGNSSSQLSFELPCFFRSVSSHETQLEPDAALKALRAMSTSTVLISAYDLANDKKKKELIAEAKHFQLEGSIVLMDSGNYEAQRKSDKKWIKRTFRRVLRESPFDIAFCFDAVTKIDSAEGLAEDTTNRVARDQRVSGQKAILPIVHVPNPPESKPEAMIKIAAEAIALVSEELRPTLVAIPERELGDGIWERVLSVKLIRRHLDALGWYQPLHLLGTGNPISIALLCAPGADVFDGLEWCRTAVDQRTGLLHHYQHYDMFAGQLAGSASNASSRGADKVTYNAKVAIHNLSFFDTWMSLVRQHRSAGTLGSFLLEKLEALPGKAVEGLISTMPELMN